MYGLFKSEFYKLIKCPWSGFAWFICLVLVSGFCIILKEASLYEQIVYMGDFLPILICFIIGSIWALEYSNATIKDLFCSQYPRRSIFFVKVIESFVSISILILIYALIVFVFNLFLFRSNPMLFYIFIVQGILVFAQGCFLIFLSIVYQSFSKLALAALCFLIFHRVSYSMYIAGAYLQFTSKTFLSLFYGIKPGGGDTIGLSLYYFLGFIFLMLSYFIFLCQEVK